MIVLHGAGDKTGDIDVFDGVVPGQNAQRGGVGGLVVDFGEIRLLPIFKCKHGVGIRRIKGLVV